MISRRSLLASAAALSPLALAGCFGLPPGASVGQTINAGVDALYKSLVTAAQVLEHAVSVAVTDIKAAVAIVLPYAVTCCRVVESMDSLSQTLQTNGTIKPAAGSKTAIVLGDLHSAATNSAIAVTAQTGVLPSDPVTIITDMIQLAALVMQVTGKQVTPTVAAATA